MTRETLDIRTIDYKERSSRQTRMYFPCKIENGVADCVLSALANIGFAIDDISIIKVYLVPHISTNHLSIGLVVNSVTKDGEHVTSKIALNTPEKRIENLLTLYFLDGAAGLSKQYANYFPNSLQITSALKMRKGNRIQRKDVTTSLICCREVTPRSRLSPRCKRATTTIDKETAPEDTTPGATLAWGTVYISVSPKFPI